MHGGMSQPITTNLRVKAGGQPIVTQQDMYSISGCPYCAGINAHALCHGIMDQCGIRGSRQAGCRSSLRTARPTCVPNGTGFTIVMTRYGKGTMMNIDYPYHFDNHRPDAETTEDDHIRDLIEPSCHGPGETGQSAHLRSGLMRLIFAPLNDALAATVQMSVQGASSSGSDRIRVEGCRWKAKTQPFASRFGIRF